jgi:hypothetical protein
LVVAINIKNQRAVAAIQRLAASYGGVSYAAAIEAAAEAALRQPRPDEASRLTLEVERIAAEYRAHLPAADPLNQEDLYGPDGLYK